MDFTKLGQTAAANTTSGKTFEKKEREAPAAGAALLRLKDYIETGKHNNKSKQYNKDVYKATLIFELNHPKHLIEVGEKKVPQLIFLNLNKSNHEKAKYRAVFKKMNEAAGGNNVHFVQMLGKAFVGKIVHNEGANGKTYANLVPDAFAAPIQEDVLTGESTPIPVMELQGESQVFLWNSGASEDDVRAMFKSCEGKEGKESWIHKAIRSNLEYEGSREQGIIDGFVALEEPKAEEPASEDGDIDDLLDL